MGILTLSSWSPHCSWWSLWSPVTDCSHTLSLLSRREGKQPLVSLSTKQIVIFWVFCLLAKVNVAISKIFTVQFIVLMVPRIMRITLGPLSLPTLICHYYTYRWPSQGPVSLSHYWSNVLWKASLRCVSKMHFSLHCAVFRDHSSWLIRLALRSEIKVS